MSIPILIYADEYKDYGITPRCLIQFPGFESPFASATSVYDAYDSDTMYFYNYASSNDSISNTGDSSNDMGEDSGSIDPDNSIHQLNPSKQLNSHCFIIKILAVANNGIKLFTY